MIIFLNIIKYQLYNVSSLYVTIYFKNRDSKHIGRGPQSQIILTAFDGFGSSLQLGINIAFVIFVIFNLKNYLIVLM